MPSQRPYFLSSFLAAFRQQQSHPLQGSQQPNKQTTTTTATASAPRNISTNAASASAATASSSSSSGAAAASSHSNRTQSAGVAIHSPRGSSGSSHGIPIPHNDSSSRRRGSDSSSEGFRDVLGADKWYIGGKTATGEEKFFKLGVVRRVRSNDGLSLDRLSL
jgi:transcription elongation factor